ncbi:MAG: GGDEF domain-containing protein [Saccharofermentans sp.]|nr:GGDEF domain-containing protein [Saccharofermentans sp.]
MATKHTKNTAIKQLDSELRAKIQKIVLVFILVISVIEICLGAYFHLSHTMRQSLSEYVLFRIVVPFVLNVLLYLTLYFVNKSSKLSDVVRNRVSSSALIFLCGEVSLCHSYYIQLWTVTLFGLIFAGVFHDASFQKVQSYFCYACIVLAGICHIADYPDQLAYSIECIVVSEVVAIAVTYLASVLEKASSQRYLLNVKANEGVEKYKMGYEYDALTGVYSRGRLDELAKDVFTWSKSYEPVGIAMLDIDDFKKVNDTYGHDNGDVVLRQLGKLLAYFNDNKNICGRFGGEEFLIIFPNSTAEKDIDALNKVRELFQDIEFDFMDKPITISVGYHACKFGSSFDASLKMADDALYESKRTGKNKVTVKD